MTKQISLLFVFILLWTSLSFAVAPAGYYATVEGKNGDAVLAALFAVISNHTNVGYDGLYTVYRTSDVRPGTNEVWDMYSTCTFTHGNKKCGNYSDVCDCYNREHGVPQSWFGKAAPMVSDAFHVIPTDGKVNNQRGNYPYGECANGSRLTSKSLCKVGSCTFPGYSGTVFEPDDEYKGDLARAYFYMAACYRDKNFTQSSGSTVFTCIGGVTGLTTYAVNLFLKWHRQDPVSQKELDRNEAIYAHQHNRNPFIDYPCLAEYIWGNMRGQTVSLATLSDCAGDTINPGPVPDPTGFRLLPVTDIHTSSAVLHWTSDTAASYTLDVYQTFAAGEEEITLLTDTAGSKAIKGGFTEDTEVDGAIRLGSGSQTGSLTYTGLSLPKGGQVRVEAIRYNSDNSPAFTVTFGSLKKTFAADNTRKTFALDIVPQSGTQDLVIATAEKKKRIYVYKVDVVSGGLTEDTVRVAGFPMNVGNTLSYRVDGLENETRYNYTVTSSRGHRTDEGMFVTEEGWTGNCFVVFPELDCRIANGILTLTGIPDGAEVVVYDLMGRQLACAGCSNGTGCNPIASEYHLAVPRGICLVYVRTSSATRTIKINNQ